MKRYLVAVLLIGCASASTDGGGNRPDAGGNRPDSGGGGGEDAGVDAAPPVDAAPQMVTLSQTADTTVAAASSLACGSSAGYTRENSWYRVFDLASMGVTGPLEVSQVTFGAQESGPAAQTLQVKIGTYAGTPGTTLDTAMITPINSANANVPASGTGQIITVPMTGTIPANSKLVVEIFSPDRVNTTTFFYVGASAGTEQAPGYVRAPACNILQPQSMKALDPAAGSLIVTVTGTH